MKKKAAITAAGTERIVTAFGERPMESNGLASHRNKGFDQSRNCENMPKNQKKTIFHPSAVRVFGLKNAETKETARHSPQTNSQDPPCALRALRCFLRDFSGRPLRNLRPRASGNFWFPPAE